MSETPGGPPQRPSELELREALARTFIGSDLLHAMNPTEGHAVAGPSGRTPDDMFPVVIEANSRFPGGAGQARLLLVRDYLERTSADETRAVNALLQRGIDPRSSVAVSPLGAPPFYQADRLDLENSFWTDHHLIGTLTYGTIISLAAWAREHAGDAPPIYKIWLNHKVTTSVFESVRTVKCDAARSAFGAEGEDIVWAIADTGIDGGHPHFATHSTLSLPSGLDHHDFTGGVQAAGGPHPALIDTDGHGTHVSGIVAGETVKDPAGAPSRLTICQEVRVSDSQTAPHMDDSRSQIAGVARKCKLMSLKVLADRNAGDVGLLLAAIGYIQAANNNGRDLKVHGVNLSLGYAFDARWFAAGQSPLCVEVDRLVKSGVVVVVAAGNGGYGTVQTLDRKAERAAHLGTINDPGNAELAITVGSTHRDSPHTFGISYFSGKGPTSDGRMKPDLAAPGERIVSCDLMANAPQAGDAPFCELSGTSMAAPHVSGAIAAFLSVRREFRGQPEKVKGIFKASATDLGRQPEFQGAGLIDAMRALQSV